MVSSVKLTNSYNSQISDAKWLKKAQMLGTCLTGCFVLVGIDSKTPTKMYKDTQLFLFALADVLNM